MTSKPKVSAIQVKPSELPACCPPKSQQTWNQHPRVYIELDKSKLGACPYCGNQFELVSED